MKYWVTRAKELLAVLEQHPTTAVQSAEAHESKLSRPCASSHSLRIHRIVSASSITTTRPL
jgi:hypothetical protein